MKCITFLLSINVSVTIISWNNTQPIHSNELSNIGNQKSHLTFCLTHFLIEMNCMLLIKHKVCFQHDNALEVVTLAIDYCL